MSNFYNPQNNFFILIQNHMFKIWLVWATNVWKSTLFNRLIWQFRAIVTDIPGTTVDIIYHEMEIDWIWKVAFGDSPWLLEFDQEWIFIKKIIDESDLILFVIDDGHVYIWGGLRIHCWTKNITGYVSTWLYIQF